MGRRYIVFQLILILAISFQNVDCQSVFPCSINNCQFCTSNSTCGLCNNGFILTVPINNGLAGCEPITCNVANCSYCMITNICESCLNNLVPNLVGQCTTSTSKNFLCPSPLSNYCLLCSNITGQPSCTRCIAGYILLQNKSCAPPSSANPLCQITTSNFTNVSPTICALCYSPTQTLGLSPTYTCKAYNPNLVCQTGCQQCSSTTTCSFCQPGYVLNIGSLQCSKSNIDYCYYQSSPNVCGNCLEGFAVVNNICVQAAYGCTLQNCKICSGNDVCYQCNSGYVPYPTGYYTICLTPQQINQLFSSLLMVRNCQLYATNAYISDFLQQLPPQNQIQYAPLCMQCQIGFILMGGLCLPQLYPSLNCSIQNCVSCIANNYCGLCNNNSKAIDGVCVSFSIVLQGCLVPGYSGGGALICALCQEGWININSICLPNLNITCNITGCEYCTQNNTCAQCQSGWQSQTNPTTQITTCILTCNISNCYQCSYDPTPLCTMCNIGWVIDMMTGGCITPEQYCPTEFGTGCLDCNQQHGCVKCSAGFGLENGKCCTAQNVSIIGCMLSSPCSATCVECYPGYIKTNKGQCFSIPCNISNCIYCSNNSTCEVCSIGYTFDPQLNLCYSNLAALSCRTPQNPYCTSCTGSTCNSCDYYATLIGGQCYCNIPGCLRCLGNKICTECAYPLAPNVVDGGCILRPQQKSLCLVSNCALCSIQPTMCSMCTQGYSINSNQNKCSLNQCSKLPNCVSCNKPQTICYSCKPSYALSTLNGSNCVAISSSFYSCNIVNCALCSTTNQSQCLQCIQNYKLTSPTQCTRTTCPSNCLYCLNQRSCLVCDESTYLSSNFICQTKDIKPWLLCQQQMCLQCNNNNQCLTCMLGYQPNNAGQCAPQDCTIPNCRVCLPSATPGFCMICKQGYFLNSYLQCIQYSPLPLYVPCSAPNCLYCYENNMCSVCFPGYQVQLGMCVFKDNCQDDKCQYCVAPGICAICRGGFYLLSSGYCSNLYLIFGIFIPFATIVIATIAACLYMRHKRNQQLSLMEKLQPGEASQIKPNQYTAEVELKESPPRKVTANDNGQILLTTRQGQL